MAARDWNPDLYATFADLRARPFWDLAALIDESSPIESMADLGCGSGELTVALATRLGVASAVGVDSSSAMLAKAADVANDHVSFAYGDISAWRSERPVDLIVANASLQWLPDHAAVIERWVASLAEHGQIAIQVPANADHPSHTCSAAVATREPFVSAMGGAPPADPVAANVLAPERYAELLFTLGIRDPHIRLQVYPQVMETSAAVVEWTSGTSLTRFFKVLPDDLHDSFVDAYRHELLATIGDHAPYFYAFKRILIHGRRGS
jgi:trans-aconitate 2-methyltransferase